MSDIVWEVIEGEVAKCNEKRGERGTVTCERTPGHDEFHVGRGKGGRWFFWDVLAGPGGET